MSPIPDLERFCTYKGAYWRFGSTSGTESKRRACGQPSSLAGEVGTHDSSVEAVCQLPSHLRRYARDGSETDGGVCAIKQEKVLSRISSRLRTRQTGLEMEGELLVRAVADG